MPFSGERASLFWWTRLRNYNSAGKAAFQLTAWIENVFWGIWCRVGGDAAVADRFCRLDLSLCLPFVSLSMHKCCVHCTVLCMCYQTLIRAHLYASMKGILRLSLISGKRCSLMEQRKKNSKNAACCFHRPPSQAAIILIFRGGAVSRSWQSCCIESRGWGLYKVLQDAFFCSWFLPWDTEHKQCWGYWSKDKIYPGHTVPQSCTTEFTTSFRKKMNFNEASLHPIIILK